MCCGELKVSQHGGPCPPCAVSVIGSCSRDMVQGAWVVFNTASQLYEIDVNNC